MLIVVITTVCGGDTVGKRSLALVCPAERVKDCDVESPCSLGVADTDALLRAFPGFHDDARAH